MSNELDYIAQHLYVEFQEAQGRAAGVRWWCMRDEVRNKWRGIAREVVDKWRADEDRALVAMTPRQAS